MLLTIPTFLFSACPKCVNVISTDKFLAERFELTNSHIYSYFTRLCYGFLH